MKRFAVLLVIAACQAPPPRAIAHHEAPAPIVEDAGPPPVEAVEVDAAAPEAPAPAVLTGDPIQTWHVHDYDVVASLPVGTRRRRPVVVGIHGSHDRPEAACARFRKTFAAWAFVVCPEGVPYKKGLAWGSAAGIADRIDGALAELKTRYGGFIAEGPVVYAGWSLGATRGPSVVALRPGLFQPVVLAEIGHTRIDASAAARAVIKGRATRVLVACATKRCASFEQRLKSAAKLSGPVVSFVDAGIGRGHVFDDEMARQIGVAMTSAVENDPRWAGFEDALKAAPRDEDGGAPLPEDEDDAE